MPHHHLEGRPIEVPLGEARHSEEVKLFPIALFNKSSFSPVSQMFLSVFPQCDRSQSVPFHGQEPPTFKIFHGRESPSYKIFHGWESPFKSLSQKTFLLLTASWSSFLQRSSIPLKTKMFPLGSTNAFLVVCDNMMILKPTSFFICCFYFIKKGHITWSTTVTVHCLS